MSSQKGRDFWILHNVRNKLLPATLDVEFVQNHLKDPEVNVSQYMDQILNRLEALHGFMDSLGWLYKEPEVATSTEESLKEALVLVEPKKLETGMDIQIQSDIQGSLPGASIDKTVFTGVLANLLLDSIQALENLAVTKHIITVSASYLTPTGLVVVRILNPHRLPSDQESKMFEFGDPPNIGDDGLLWASEAVRITGGWITASHSHKGMQFEICIPHFKA